MKRAKRIIAAGILILLIVAGGCGSKASPDNAGTDQGFKTPEEVMEHFSKKISEGDLVGASQFFAVNLVAENYNIEAHLENIQTWLPNQPMPYPSDDPSYLEVNKQALKANAVKQISNMCFSLEADSEYLDMDSVSMMDKDISEFTESMQLHDLDSFTYKSMELTNADLQNSDSYKERVKKMTGIYGYDEQQENVIEYEWNGHKYTGFATFVKYDNLWYLYSLHSTLSDRYSTGYLTKQ